MTLQAMLQSILSRVDHVLLQSSTMLVNNEDDKCLIYLGMTYKQLSGKGFERMSSPAPSKIKSGNFIFYDKTLAICISECNHANECYVLIMERITHNIEKTQLKKTNIDLTSEPRDFLKLALKQKIEYETNDNEINNNDVVSWNEKLLVVKEKIHKRVPNWSKCTEYIAQIQPITIDSNTCVLLQAGNASCLLDDMKEISPPSKFVDNGFFDESIEIIFKVSYCTFLAMIQHEIVFGDTPISIKHYFCNNPYKQNTKINWKVYCGRILKPIGFDDDNDEPHFIQKKTVKWVNDQYVNSRSEETDSAEFIFNGFYRHRGNHSRIFINIFIIIHHWARHDASKSDEADKFLWRLDLVYNPYDNYYRPSLNSAQETLLKTYDFTITQCLRLWVDSIISEVQYKVMDIYQREDKGQFYERIKKDMILTIQELNDMIPLDSTATNSLDIVPAGDDSDRGRFPDPIQAALDSRDDANYTTYKTWVIAIIRNAVKEAFPLFIDDNENLFFDPEKFADFIDEHYFENIRSLVKVRNITPPWAGPLNSLQAICIKTLAGGWASNDSEFYDIATQLREQVVCPSALLPNDIILIFDEEGVTVAYFIRVVWKGKSEVLDNELNERGRNISFHRDAFTFGKFEKYDICIPVIRYRLMSRLPIESDRSSIESDRSSIKDIEVREIFNVYTINKTQFMNRISQSEPETERLSIMAPDAVDPLSPPPPP